MDIGPWSHRNYESILVICGDAIEAAADEADVPAGLYVSLYGHIKESMLTSLIRELGVGRHTITVSSDMAGERLTVTAPVPHGIGHLGTNKLLALAVFLLLAASGPRGLADIIARTTGQDGQTTLQGWIVVHDEVKPVSADVLRTLYSLGESAPGTERNADYLDAFEPPTSN
ncbi:hypothetical protein [Streptomyces niveus]|uniref:hypothetical protein n=1 Tax=Streptomyces niveus TaxID=193462 RepID=UPI0034304C08